MKKLCSMTLVLAILMSILSVGGFAAKDQQTAKKIVVHEVKGGSATIQKGTKRSFEATVGSKIASGDVVSTGEKTTTSFLIDDKTMTILDEYSKVSVTTASKSKLKLTLVSGTISMNVKKLADDESSIEVSAGNSIIGIRGTIPVMSYQNGKLVLDLLSGSVAVDTPQGQYMVEPGQRITCVDGKNATDVVIEDIKPSTLSSFALETVANNKDQVKAPQFDTISKETVEQMASDAKAKEEQAFPTVPKQAPSAPVYLPESGGNTPTDPPVGPEEPIDPPVEPHIAISSLNVKWVSESRVSVKITADQDATVYIVALPARTPPPESAQALVNTIEQQYFWDKLEVKANVVTSWTGFDLYLDESYVFHAVAVDSCGQIHKVTQAADSLIVSSSQCRKGGTATKPIITAVDNADGGYDLSMDRVGSIYVLESDTALSNPTESSIVGNGATMATRVAKNTAISHMATKKYTYIIGRDAYNASGNATVITVKEKP